MPGLPEKLAGEGLFPAGTGASGHKKSPGEAIQALILHLALDKHVLSTYWVPATALGTKKIAETGKARALLSQSLLSRGRGTCSSL